MSRLPLLLITVTACGYQIPETHEGVLADITEWRCTARQRCFGNRVRTSIARSHGGPVFDFFDDCVAEAGAPGGDNDRTLDAIEAGRVQIDRLALLACRTALTNISCHQLSSGERTACDKVFVGLAGPGAGCFIDEECSNGDGIGLCRADANECGHCEQVPMLGQNGDTCLQFADCDRCFFCSAGICTSVPDENAKDRGELCGIDDGAWTPPISVGNCRVDSNLVCVDGRCQTALFSDRIGEECMVGRVLCDRNLVCAIDSDQGNSCQKPGGLGATCRGQAGEYLRSCASGLTCVRRTGLCAKPFADGESCAFDDRSFASGNCEDNRCAPAVADPLWRDC